MEINNLEIIQKYEYTEVINLFVDFIIIGFLISASIMLIGLAIKSLINIFKNTFK